MWNRLTSGAKFAIILLLVGGLFTGFYFFKKNQSGDNSSNTGTTDKGNFTLFESEPDITLGVNTWSGFAPIVWLNGGLEPNEDSRLYKEYGIKLRIKIIDIFNDSRNSFKSDKINVVYCTTDALPIDMGSSAGMAEFKVKQFLQVDWSRGGDLIVVTKGINTVADLKGKTVSVAEGTASNSLLIKVLETNGLAMTDINIKKVSDGIESANLFKAGAVDAAVVWTPDDGDCLKAIPGSKVLTSTKVATHIIADGLLAKEEFINKNHDELVKFATAWLTANGEINISEDAKRKAAAAFAKAFNTDEGFAMNGLNNIRLTTLGDNKDFFGLNTQYLGVTGEQIYTKMSLVYSELKLTQAPLPWRSVSETNIVEALNIPGDKQKAEDLTKFKPATDQVKQKEAMSNKKVTINFQTGSYTLDDDDKATIDKEFVNIAKTFTNARIRIEGNTDAVGSNDINMPLSQRRAQSVADYLIREYKFDPNRFIVIGNGSKFAIRDGVSGANEYYRKTDFQLVQE